MESHSLVGLGTGSTAYYALERLGHLLSTGALTEVRAVASSNATAEIASSFGIPLVELPAEDFIDVSIDGADAVGPELALIKGRGGAFVREKLIHSRAKCFVCIVDETKMSLTGAFGSGTQLPVEVIPFGWRSTRNSIAHVLGIPLERVARRTRATNVFTTDNGNYVLDSIIAVLSDPRKTATALKQICGVVDHGLFVDMAHQVICADTNGKVRRTGRDGDELLP